MFDRWLAFKEVGPLVLEYALDISCAAAYLLYPVTPWDSKFLLLTCTTLALKHASVTQGTNDQEKPHSRAVYILGLLGCLPIVLGFRHIGAPDIPAVFTDIYLLYGSFGLCPTIAAMVSAVRLGNISLVFSLFAIRAAVGVWISSRSTFLLNRINLDRSEHGTAATSTGGVFYTHTFQAAIRGQLPWAYYFSLMFARLTSWVVAFLAFPFFFAAGALIADFFCTTLLACWAYARSTSEKWNNLWCLGIQVGMAYALANPDEFNLAHRNLQDFHRRYFALRLVSLIVLNAILPFGLSFRAPQTVVFCWYCSVACTGLYTVIEVACARTWRSLPITAEDQRLLAETAGQRLWHSMAPQSSPMHRPTSPASSREDVEQPLMHSSTQEPMEPDLSLELGDLTRDAARGTSSSSSSDSMGDSRVRSSNVPSRSRSQTSSTPAVSSTTSATAQPTQSRMAPAASAASSLDNAPVAGYTAPTVKIDVTPARADTPSATRVAATQASAPTKSEATPSSSSRATPRLDSRPVASGEPSASGAHSNDDYRDDVRDWAQPLAKPDVASGFAYSRVPLTDDRHDDTSAIVHFPHDDRHDDTSSTRGKDLILLDSKRNVNDEGKGDLAEMMLDSKRNVAPVDNTHGTLGAESPRSVPTSISVGATGNWRTPAAESHTPQQTCASETPPMVGGWLQTPSVSLASETEGEAWRTPPGAGEWHTPPESMWSADLST